MEFQAWPKTTRLFRGIVVTQSRIVQKVTLDNEDRGKWENG